MIGDSGPTYMGCCVVRGAMCFRATLVWFAGIGETMRRMLLEFDTAVQCGLVLEHDCVFGIEGAITAWFCVQR